MLCIYECDKYAYVTVFAFNVRTREGFVFYIDTKLYIDNEIAPDHSMQFEYVFIFYICPAL